MTPRFRLTLVCCLLLCLLLGLTQPVGLNHNLPIVGLRPEFDRGRQPASDAPTVSVARSMQSSAHAGPRQSLVFSGTLIVVNTGPPGWGKVGPPAVIAVLASCRSGGNAGNSKTNTLEHHSPRKYWLKPPISKIRGFTTPFS
jgi:hypothetical protein